MENAAHSDPRAMLFYVNHIRYTVPAVFAVAPVWPDPSIIPPCAVEAGQFVSSFDETFLRKVPVH